MLKKEKKKTSKSYNVGKESKKIQILFFFFFIFMMCLSLYAYQAKVSRYRKGLKCLKNRATTNQNRTLQSQKQKRKVLKHKINGNHQTQKRKEEKQRINWKTRFKMAINTYLSIIPLNVNGLHAPIKRQRVAEWIKKQKPSICCLQETHLRAKDT